MNEKSPITIYLVDDHALLRDSVTILLDSQPDMTVVGSQSDALQGVNEILANRPDVVVMDLSMPGMDGAKAIAMLNEQAPEIKVLALTRHSDQGYLHKAMDVGARGYVVKRAAADDLLTAIRAVAAGELYVDPSLAGKMVANLIHKSSSDKKAGRRALSPREEQVLRFISLGYSNSEIASELGISVKTVEYQRAKGMEKLGFRSRVDIVKHAVREGWLEDA